MAPRLVTPDDLAGAAKAALGGHRRLTRVDRLAGGTQKGVYRLTMDDASTAIAYLWGASENFWPATAWDGNPADPFSPSTGLDFYLPARNRLESLGLRVPELYLVDRDREHYPAEIAILEDFPGEDMLEFHLRDPESARPTVARFAEDLATLRSYRAPGQGKVGFVDGGGVSDAPTPEAAALAFGLRSLDDAATRSEKVAAARDELAERLRTVAAAVRPRTEWSVVHGELGFDHVMVDKAGRPVIIDIDNLMYFDAEWEFVFLRIYMHQHYATVALDGLDEDRLALYMLTQRLSLVAGPLRIVEGDIPNPEFFLDIADHNFDEARAWLTDAPHRRLTACCHTMHWPGAAGEVTGDKGGF